MDTSSGVNIIVPKSLIQSNNWTTPLYCYVYDAVSGAAGTVGGYSYTNALWPGQQMKYDAEIDSYYLHLDENKCLAARTTKASNGFPTDQEEPVESDFNLAKSQNTHVILSDSSSNNPGVSQNNQYPRTYANYTLDLNGKSHKTTVLSGRPDDTNWVVVDNNETETTEAPTEASTEEPTEPQTEPQTDPSTDDYYTTSNGTQIDLKAQFNRDETDTTDFGVNGPFQNLQILGVQKKETADGQHSIRFVAVVKDEILQDADDYGFIAIGSSSLDKVRTAAPNITVESVSKKYSCKDKNNLISGDYGKHDSDTGYKYVTFAVNNIGNNAVGVRFYVQKGTSVHYADYINDNNETLSYCAADWASLN